MAGQIAFVFLFKFKLQNPFALCPLHGQMFSKMVKLCTIWICLPHHTRCNAQGGRTGEVGSLDRTVRNEPKQLLRALAVWILPAPKNSTYLYKSFIDCPCYLSKEWLFVSAYPHGWPSPPGTIHILIGKFSYFVIRFLNQFFFVINFSYFVIRFLLNISIVKSDNEIGKVNDKKNMI